MDQVGQRRGRLPEGDIGIRLIRHRHDAMVGGDGVGDDLNIALGHMTAPAVVGRCFLHARCERQLAALVRMTGEAFAVEICRRLFAGRLIMRIVASNAAQAPLAGSIALA